MTKRWNGKKMSHTKNEKPRVRKEKRDIKMQQPKKKEWLG